MTERVDFMNNTSENVASGNWTYLDEQTRRKMHELPECGLMHVKLREDIARHGHIATSCASPCSSGGRYVTDPSRGLAARMTASPPWPGEVTRSVGEVPFDTRIGGRRDILTMSEAGDWPGRADDRHGAFMRLPLSRVLQVRAPVGGCLPPTPPEDTCGQKKP